MDVDNLGPVLPFGMIGFEPGLTGGGELNEAEYVIHCREHSKEKYSKGAIFQV